MSKLVDRQLGRGFSNRRRLLAHTSKTTACRELLAGLKSELEGAKYSESEREAHLKGREATIKMETAKERASFAGQLEVANKQIKTLKTEVSKKALEVEEARLCQDNLRQEREEAVERIHVEATKRLADMQERVSELSAKNKVLKSIRPHCVTFAHFVEIKISESPLPIERGARRRGKGADETGTSF